MSITSQVQNRTERLIWRIRWLDRYALAHLMKAKCTLHYGKYNTGTFGIHWYPNKREEYEKYRDRAACAKKAADMLAFRLISSTQAVI